MVAIILILAVLVAVVVFFLLKKKKSTTTTTTTSGTNTTTTTTIPKEFYTWFVTEGNNHGCGDEVGSTKYYTSEQGPNLITKFYTNESLLTVYSPGSGKLGFSSVSGPMTYAKYEVNVDDDGNVSSLVSCK